jgi:serine/threonine-protein kinase
VCSSDLDGQQVTLATLGPGEVFGETAILTSKPRTANVLAVSDVILKVLDREAMERELERTGWMRHIVLSLAERFRTLAGGAD